jgi:syndecan 1
MKCIADGVVVDISANQFGGLATLGFLEEVDAFIARDGIFKRSIILIKAWGFYEGRVLGAHHALISTYALETLVLYVLNAYHEELSTPLEVLHKFLTYFADFEWDAYAVSIHGPVRLDALEKGVRDADAPARGPLLTPAFTKRVLDKYGNDAIINAEKGQAGPGGGGNRRAMQPKHLNVIDPLLPSNNLGRSVSQGNAKRIQKALRLGAAKLTSLRNAMRDGVSCELNAVRVLEHFFGCTIRHRRDVPLPSAPATPGGCLHPDETSLTPMGTRGFLRSGAVSVLASPSPSPSPGRRGGGGAAYSPAY